MSANLIGGFHSRLEGSRKYLFGSAGVYGKANASKIQGAYMIRGQDYKGVFDVAPDWESYDFEKLDFNKDAEFIKGCWNWDNTCVASHLISPPQGTDERLRFGAQLRRPRVRRRQSLQVNASPPPVFHDGRLPRRGFRRLFEKRQSSFHARKGRDEWAAARYSA